MRTSITSNCIRQWILVQVLILFACADFEVTIDKKDQLDAIGATDTCSYINDFSQLCKTGPHDNGNSGFWSSCSSSACEISIPLNQIGNSHVLPNKMTFQAYVYGNNAQIRLRYRLTPASQLLNMRPDLPLFDDWSSTSYDLTEISGLNFDSEIIILFSSGEYPMNADIIDSIVFAFPGETSTVSEEDSTTSRSEIPTHQRNKRKYRMNYRKDARQ